MCLWSTRTHKFNSMPHFQIDTLDVLPFLPLEWWLGSDASIENRKHCMWNQKVNRITTLLRKKSIWKCYLGIYSTLPSWLFAICADASVCQSFKSILKWHLCLSLSIKRGHEQVKISGYAMPRGKKYGQSNLIALIYCKHTHTTINGHTDKPKKIIQLERSIYGFEPIDSLSISFSLHFRSVCYNISLYHPHQHTNTHHTQNYAKMCTVSSLFFFNFSFAAERRGICYLNELEPYYFDCNENKNNKFQFIRLTHLPERNENQIIRHNFRRDLLNTHVQCTIRCFSSVCYFVHFSINFFLFCIMYVLAIFWVFFLQSNAHTYAHGRKLCTVQMKQGHTHKN